MRISQASAVVYGTASSIQRKIAILLRRLRNKCELNFFVMLSRVGNTIFSRVSCENDDYYDYSCSTLWGGWKATFSANVHFYGNKMEFRKFRKRFSFHWKLGQKKLPEFQVDPSILFCLEIPTLSLRVRDFVSRSEWNPCINTSKYTCTLKHRTVKVTCETRGITREKNGQSQGRRKHKLVLRLPCVSLSSRATR